MILDDDDSRHQVINDMDKIQNNNFDCNSKIDEKNDGIIKEIQPTKFSGLKQAAYIMKCICKGEYFEQIVQKFDGDAQLVKLWMSYLLHNRCIESPFNDHEWIVTEKGKQWMTKYDYAK